jgi:hypothetical protein
MIFIIMHLSKFIGAATPSFLRNPDLGASYMSTVVKGKLGTFALGGAGAVMLVVGTLHLISPRMMMEAPAIELTTVNHLHLIRAALGGAFLGIATLFLLGLFRDRMRTFALLSVVILFSGFAFGRLVSIVLDGVPAGMFLGILAFELTFAVLAVFALRTEQRG